LSQTTQQHEKETQAINNNFAQWTSKREINQTKTVAVNTETITVN